jgi:hypothetical protein
MAQVSENKMVGDRKFEPVTSAVCRYRPWMSFCHELVTKKDLENSQKN